MGAVIAFGRPGGHDMNRFVRFLVMNLAGLGLVGWLQASLFDVDAVKTRMASSGWRFGGGGGSSHK